MPRQSFTSVTPPICASAPITAATARRDSSRGGRRDISSCANTAARVAERERALVHEEADRGRVQHRWAEARPPRADTRSCSRAVPPPVKNASSVCAANWTTFSPRSPAASPARARPLHGAEHQSLRARCGRSRRPPESLRAGYAPRPRLRGVRVGEAALPSRPSVRNATTPSSVRRKRSPRGWRPVACGRSARSRRRRFAALGRASSASGSSGSAPASTPGTAAQIAPRRCSATACASSSGRSPGSFRCSDSSVRPSDVSTSTLWTSRTRGTPSAAACARSRTPAVLVRLDVDDDVAAWQRR